MKNNYAIIESPLGNLRIEGDEDGISLVQFTEEDCTGKEIVSPIIETVVQLREYFDSKRRLFDLKLNPKGTEFQKKVWEALKKIEFGRTCSYMEIAKSLNNPLSIRAVGSANGRNPIAIIIPCHRVIGSDGSLTGYAGGLGRKKWLLDLENPSQQLSLFD